MAQGRSWFLKRITLLASRDTIEFIALSAFQGCFPAPVCYLPVVAYFIKVE